MADRATAMTCQACQSAEATTHVTERTPSGTYAAAHYCDPCARRLIPGIPTACDAYLKPSREDLSRAEMEVWLPEMESWSTEMEAVMNAVREARTLEEKRAANKRAMAFFDAFFDAMPRVPGESL